MISAVAYISVMQFYEAYETYAHEQKYLGTQYSYPLVATEVLSHT